MNFFFLTLSFLVSSASYSQDWIFEVTHGRDQQNRKIFTKLSFTSCRISNLPYKINLNMPNCKKSSYRGVSEKVIECEHFQGNLVAISFWHNSHGACENRLKKVAKISNK